MTESAPKLFMVYIGGHTPTSNIEAHDVRFVVGNKINDCYIDVQSQWWGDPDTLHLDCWGAVEYADGYGVSLSTTPPTHDTHKLFFVNLGGYNPDIFDELHKNILVVAENEPMAKQKAKDTIKHWKVPHKDTSFEIEKAIDISTSLKNLGLYIHLTPTQNSKEFTFECMYTPISQKALAKKK